MENCGDDIGELCHMFTTFSFNTFVVHIAGPRVLGIETHKSLTSSLTLMSLGKLLRASATRFVLPC